MALYRDSGIVLRTHKLGEADRIVTFLTEHHGKVRAVAKGARKTKSRFGARLEAPSHAALQLYGGRSDLDIVTQAETIDHFRPVRTDLDRFARAATMLEAVDQITPEREPNRRLYAMLLGALHSLSEHDSPVVVAAFFWKLLSAEGVEPVVDACVTCGEEADLVAFDPIEGGVLCRAHRRGVPIGADALALLRDVLGGRLRAALAVPASPATAELDHLAVHTMEQHLERRLRSVGLLDRG
ncbi:MAG: DNA repair protein RecO [Actinobacteria bacterium]|nr:DNA repair protein RecO [Actinomycetota bacterium]